MYLGINAYSHDSSACLIDNDGRIVAAAEEERFTQKKHFSGFPELSIKYCLKTAGIRAEDLKGVAVGWSAKELWFDRAIKEYVFQFHPPFYVYKKTLKKLYGLVTLNSLFEKKIGKLSSGIKMEYFSHHKAHAASAFYASGFDDAAFLTMDARGEYYSSLWGEVDYQKGLDVKGNIYHPNSLGVIWGGISEYCGFKPGWQKAGTTMAYAALGTPKYKEEMKKVMQFYPERDSNWLEVTTKYFRVADCKGEPKKLFEDLIGAPSAQPGKYEQVHADVAASLQEYTQDIILGKLNDIYKKTGKDKLVMAGGVCLNSVTNGLILEKTPFKDFFIQPASHDAGVAIGAAYLLYQKFNNGKKPEPVNYAYFGPEYSQDEINLALLPHPELEIEIKDEVYKDTAKIIADGEVVMWFQGRLEFGPRALGSRSILASTVNKGMIDELNKTKYRESFRPFAISILESRTKDWLVQGNKSPYMLVVDHIKPEHKDKVPAAQHVDGSVRVQTVNENDNGTYFKLLEEYERLTGIPLFINTSFNIKGLPIVNTPEQAIEAFLESKDVRYLAMGNCLVAKKQ